MTIALGAIWELVEWQSDMLFGTDMSLGYSDTLGDMVCDVIGGFAGAVLVVLVLTRRRAQANARAAAGTGVRGDSRISWSPRQEPVPHSPDL
jgi:hypothetical protein